MIRIMIFGITHWLRNQTAIFHIFVVYEVQDFRNIGNLKETAECSDFLVAMVGTVRVFIMPSDTVLFV